MGFAGIQKDSERADVIDYLHTLADSPVPLPTASKYGGEVMFRHRHMAFTRPTAGPLPGRFRLSRSRACYRDVSPQQTPPAACFH